MLQRDDFTQVSLKDRDLFVRHYLKYPQVHSDNSFTNMVCWNHYAHYEYQFVDESLLILSTIDGETTFRAPIGEANDRLLDEVLALARDTGGKTPFSVFDQATKELIGRKYPSLILHPATDFFDYVYTTRSLSELPGKKFLQIRRQLNRFKRECGYHVEFIGTDNTREVREFLEKWCEWKECEENPVLGFEKDAVMFAVDHFSELQLEGLLLRVGDAIIAMAIFDELNPECAVVHFEKALPDCRGGYKGINYETAHYLHEKYDYINRESDLGLTGLRVAKKRYHPHHFAEVWFTRIEEM
jgi:hypothetical protein